ncbi:MAG: cell filamentation protein Fic [Anaerolineae bacterium]|nr:cell filamentation protein Fic [Anaerolineae bacterium]
MKDPYLDKNGVMKNKPGIEDAEKLRQYEYHTVAGAEVSLMQNPIKGNFDFAHLKKIHGILFGEMYSWAGRPRTVDISKGDSFFAKTAMIESAGNKLFANLAKENHLKGLEQGEFANRAAHYLGEINALHPFREGNGRTQRVFMSKLAQNAGYNLSWKGVSREEMLHASINSFHGDNKGYEKMIRNGLSEREISHAAVASRDVKRTTNEPNIKQAEALVRDKEYGI